MSAADLRASRPSARPRRRGSGAVARLSWHHWTSTSRPQPQLACRRSVGRRARPSRGRSHQGRELGKAPSAGPATWRRGGRGASPSWTKPMHRPGRPSRGGPQREYRGDPRRQGARRGSRVRESHASVTCQLTLLQVVAERGPRAARGVDAPDIASEACRSAPGRSVDQLPTSLLIPSSPTSLGAESHTTVPSSPTAHAGTTAIATEGSFACRGEIMHARAAAVHHSTFGDTAGSTIYASRSTERGNSNEAGNERARPVAVDGSRPAAEGESHESERRE